MVSRSGSTPRASAAYPRPCFSTSQSIEGANRGREPEESCNCSGAVGRQSAVGRNKKGPSRATALSHPTAYEVFSVGGGGAGAPGTVGAAPLFSAAPAAPATLAPGTTPFDWGR